MAEFSGKSFKKILIIKPSAAGDIICALPVLSGLRRIFPEAKISWLVSSHFSELIKGHPMLDDVIIFHRRRFGYVGRSWSVARRFVRFVVELKEKDFDLVIDLQGLFRSGFLAWSTQADIRIGPAEKREFSWIFYTHRVPAIGFDTHTVDRMYSTLKLFADSPPQIEFPVWIPPQADNNAKHLLKAEGLRPGQFIVIAPGGNWESKRWFPERFAQLIGRIHSELGLSSILVGSRREEKISEEILSMLPRRAKTSVVNLIKKTSLSELISIIRESALVVSGDSAPMHIAAALARPVVAIIGPTNPKRTGPYGQLENAVVADVSCSPCYKRVCPLRDPLVCMRSIGVDMVFNKIGSILGGKEKRAV